DQSETRPLRLPAHFPFAAAPAPQTRALSLHDALPIYHDVDRVLQLQHLALDVDGDLLRQIAARHRRRHVGDVAHLPRQIRGHEVDGGGQILPHATDSWHVPLPAQFSFGADLARHARDL